MPHFTRFLHKLRNFLQPGRAEHRLAREISAHLQLLQDKFQAQGMNPHEARLAAKRAYGGVEQTKQLHRDERSWLWLEQFRQDIRFSARALRKSPGFTLTVVLTLALGIGANTAIFSLIDSVMLKSLPVNHPEQLLQVTTGKEPFFTNPVWEQLRDRQDVFSGIFAYGGGRYNLSAGGEARYAQGNFASGQFFDTLGLHAMIGRTFTTADDRRGCPGTAVLSYGFWQRAYESRAGVVGKVISLDNHPFEILGVLAPGFTGVDVGRNSDIYIPLCAEKIMRGTNSTLDSRNAVWLRVMGRAKPEFSAARVHARLRTLAGPIFEATLPSDWPGSNETYRKQTLDAQIAPNGLSFFRQEYRQSLLLLMAIVALVLLIACANVANLLLARSVARHRETAIRMALGSGRYRLMRQSLTESLILSFTGAALGIFFAHWGAGLLVGFLSSNVYNNSEVFLDLHIDTRVLAFTAVTAILTGSLFGLAPAWKGTRVNAHSAMKANARGEMEGHYFGLGKVLVVAQVALSLVLVIGAALMLTTFLRLKTLNPGFEPDRVLLIDVNLPEANYSPQRRSAVFEDIREHLRGVPSVLSVSTSYETPVDNSLSVGPVQIDDPSSKAQKKGEVYLNGVSDKYFETLGTRLLSGRDFGAHDTPGSPKVAIVNQAFAREFFAGKDAVGKHYHLGDGNPMDATEIIGVVQDAKYLSLREDIKPTVYYAARQNATPGDSLTFELRVAAAEPTSVTSAVKSTIDHIDPGASFQFKTLELQVEESLARERLLATLSAFFGLLALLLAMIGLYGVMSYNVNRRRNEIGVRLALGAQQSRVLRTILGEAAILIATGLAIGLAAALATTRFVNSFLYGVKPNDPGMLLLAAVLLAAVAAVAALLPARRAARLDPIHALREE